jgi:DNA repair and recombination protein RAD52
MDWTTATAELQRKLDPANVKPAKQFGPKGDYIEGWHAMAEANRIFGFEGWAYEIPECTCVYQGAREIGQAKKQGFGVTYTAKVRVNIDGVIREDFGAGHGYDVDCGLAHESAIKEAVTDALKRALRSFGNPFGLALYDKSRENVGPSTPPFNAAAAADRIIAKLERQTTDGGLNDAFAEERDARGDVKDASPADYQRILDAAKAMKSKLNPQKEAA